MISLSQIQFAWQRDASAVLDIDELIFQPGEACFIRGPSGSGKSTLLNIIGGVLSPQQGQIRVLGQDLLNLRPSQRDRFRADHIGYIFQMFNLLPYLSVLDNVTLPLRFSPMRRDKVMTRGGAEAEARRLLAHLDLGEAHFLQRPVMELSVGQQQRVAAARALIGSPEWVIADEPTSALDAERRLRFIDLLISECREAGSGLVFVSHDPVLQDHFARHIDLPTINRAAGVSHV